MKTIKFILACLKLRNKRELFTESASTEAKKDKPIYPWYYEINN